MAEPVHKNEDDALKAVRNLHRGYADVASKLLIAHIVSDLIEILDSAKSPKLRTEEQRLRNAIAGKDLHAEKRIVRLELTKIAAEIAIKSEAEIQQDIKSLEKIHEPIISANPDLIVQLADLKRSAKRGKTPKPTPTPPLTPPPLTPPPLPPLVPHTPAVGPNIIGNTHITINTLPHSESIRGTVQIGETLHLSKDGISWTPVAVDARGNFNIPISENTNGSYTYTLKTRNLAGLESSEETVLVDINAVTTPTTPTEPTLTNTIYSIDPPEIEGKTTPNVDVELSVYGGTYTGRSNASGIFKIRPTTAIGNGPHTVQVVAKNVGISSSILTENIMVRKGLTPADLRSFTIPSLEIEQGEPKPSLRFENLKEGTRITIFDKTGRNQISDEFEVPTGTTSEDIELLTLGTEYPGEQGIIIKVEDIHGGQPVYMDRSRKVKITPRKITYSGNVTGSITSKMNRGGEIPFGSQVTASINNIPKGARLRVVGPVHRLKGASEIELGHWGNDSTKFAGAIDMDTQAAPFGVEEELEIEIYDPSRPHDASLIKKVTPVIKFKIAQEEAILNQTTVQPPVGKIKNGNDVVFRIARPNNDTEIIAEPGGLVFDVASLVPPEMRISGMTTAGKHSYTFYIQDKNHRGKPRELLGTYEIEIDHPELTLTPPAVPTTPIRCTQGGTKPSVTVSGLIPGSEVVLTGPNGELTKFIATTTSKTIALTRLDMSQTGIQDINVQVNDPHHANITPEMNTFQIDVKKKVEAPKHLPQPVFKTPLDYAEGGGDMEIELLNAVTHSEVTVEYDTAGGRTTTAPLTITADGNLKLPLAGFDAPAGTSNVRVTYRNPVSGAVNARDISMHIAPRPAIERPEGLQDETDINTKPFDVKIGKIKPGQTISITGNTEMSGGAVSIPAVLRNNGGTWMLNIPAGAQSIKQNYTIRITDTVTGDIEDFQIVVNVKVPPKSNLRIDHHNFIHACEDAKKHGTGSYRINGEPTPFSVTKGWGKYKTNFHGNNFSAKTPDELYKAVKEHLDHHNQHEKDEYNAYWGLMPETPEHKKGDSHETGEKGKDKEGGHDKGGHSEGGNESKGNKFGSALKTVLKTAAWPATGVAASLGYMALYGIGSVAIGPAIISGAVAGAGIWALRKLYRIKNPKKGGDSGGAPAH